MDYKNKPIGLSLEHNYSLCGLTGEGMAGTGIFYKNSRTAGTGF
jgi:hypothetical protein